ncbi:hypothetical protein GEMRC1_000544 [Eukaryota sp. GEM-RC1]
MDSSAYPCCLVFLSRTVPQSFGVAIVDNFDRCSYLTSILSHSFSISNHTTHLSATNWLVSRLSLSKSSNLEKGKKCSSRTTFLSFVILDNPYAHGIICCRDSSTTNFFVRHLSNDLTQVTFSLCDSYDNAMQWIKQQQQYHEKQTLNAGPRITPPNALADMFRKVF